jgi:hypothetical protein
MKTPRTVTESASHDLFDMPDTIECVRRYDKPTRRSADWRAEDLRIMKAAGVIILFVVLLVGVV